MSTAEIAAMMRPITPVEYIRAHQPRKSRRKRAEMAPLVAEAKTMLLAGNQPKCVALTLNLSTGYVCRVSQSIGLHFRKTRLHPA